MLTISKFYINALLTKNWSLLLFEANINQDFAKIKIALSYKYFSNTLYLAIFTSKRTLHYFKGYKMHLLYRATLLFLLCAITSEANMSNNKVKRQLKNNMVEVYSVLPPSAQSIDEIFTQGMFYGRLRMNSFMWDWKETDNNVNKNHNAFALGGSVIYKTAPMDGLSATAGIYYSDSPFSGLRPSQEDVQKGYVRAAKDTFSRNNVIDDNDYSMFSLAQANLQYNYKKTSFIAGRQLYESLMTSANDTKMIPNSFEGFSIASREVPHTIVRGAYFYAQKLRDHTGFHDLITYDSASGNIFKNQDDAAVHKGLSYANFTAAGKKTDHELILADIKNKSFKDVQVDFHYAHVPEILTTLTAEVNFIIQVSSDLSITPGVRYMRQIDNGGGAIGGASVDGSLAHWKNGESTNGYTNPKSLDSSMAMGRLLIKKGPFITQIAYSQVADEADFVAPWRGFPTAGYTRAIGQYNWNANAKTKSAEIFYDFSKYVIIPGFSALARYAEQDFDESKHAANMQTDSKVWHLDFRQHLTAALNAKVRVGLIDAQRRQSGEDLDSYNEYRFEVNYLF